MRRMHRVTRTLAICLGLVLLTASATAQQADDSAAEPGAESADQIHGQLQELRDRMFAAYEKRDVDALLKDVARDVVITWQNADRNEGHDEFLEFYAEMMKGTNRIVKDMSSEFEVEQLSILYGEDTAVARGTLADHFELTDGSDFVLNSMWTATVVKIDGSWKVASFHASSNIFDNPILAYAQGWLVKIGLFCGAIGLVIGLIVGRVTKRV